MTEGGHRGEDWVYTEQGTRRTPRQTSQTAKSYCPDLD